MISRLLVNKKLFIHICLTVRYRICKYYHNRFDQQIFLAKESKFINKISPKINTVTAKPKICDNYNKLVFSTFSFCILSTNCYSDTYWM